MKLKKLAKWNTKLLDEALEYEKNYIIANKIIYNEIIKFFKESGEWFTCFEGNATIDGGGFNIKNLADKIYISLNKNIKDNLTPQKLNNFFNEMIKNSTQPKWTEWFKRDLSTRKTGNKTIMEIHGENIIKNIELLLIAEKNRLNSIIKNLKTENKKLKQDIENANEQIDLNS